MNLSETIAANLRRLMEERRYDGPTFAQEMGVTKAAVYQWLDGKGMSITNLELAAKILRVEPSTLVRKLP